MLLNLTHRHGHDHSPRFHDYRNRQRGRVLSVVGRDGLTVAHRHGESLSSGRLRYWALTLGKFGLVQMVVQALGALGGILVVRGLSKSDYALFTIASSMQGTMNLLADSGVSVALMAVGGRVWQNSRRMGELIRVALGMRRKLAAFVVAAVIPLLVSLLAHNGAGPVRTAVLIAAVTTGLGFQLGLDVYIVVPRLHSQISRLQGLDLGAAALRLGMLTICFFLFLNASVAVWIATVSIAWQFLTTRRWARERIAPVAGINPEDQREVGQKIRHLLPSALFYCLQGQLVVFLLSLTGKSGQVAEVGALGRLTILLNVFTPIMGSIVLPAFSRCQTRAPLARRYFLVIGAFALLCAGLTGAAALFAGPLLWLLGPNYAGLRPLLMLMTFNTALGILVGVMWSMNSAKGWVQHVWVEIPLRLVLQAGLMFVFDLSTAEGALRFAICSQISPILVNGALTWYGLRGAPVG